MTKKYAFLFPGQGSQYQGMGFDIYEEYKVAKDVFDEADDILGFSLKKLIFKGSKEELTLTKNSQLAIFVTSIAILRAFQKNYSEIIPFVCAGLSLGEYTALCASGRIAFDDCLRLVQARGVYMQEAAEKYPGSLSVVLGLESVQVEEYIKELGKEVWIANLNCPKQVVISGTHEGLKDAEIFLKGKGAKRVLPLEVSGAFHSGLMKEAQEKLKEKLKVVKLIDSSTHFVMNVPGDFVSDLDKIRNYLIDQVASPTRWEKGIRAIEHVGCDFYIEIGCGKTLVGMNKKIGIESPSYGIEKKEEIENFENFFSETKV